MIKPIPMLSNEAADYLHRDLINRQVIHSCLNCDDWDEKSKLCKRFKALPPPEILVFSCGKNWTPLIPF